MASPVVHFEIGASNSEKSREFYAKLFDWEFQIHEGMNYAMVGPGGENSIGGGLGPLQPGQNPYVTVYVMVDDLQQYLDKAVSLGGKTLLPPTPIPGVGSCAWFADPDGIFMGLFKPNM